MRDVHDSSTDILQKLNNVDDLSPADELAVYERVLDELTELLNAPEEYGPEGG